MSRLQLVRITGILFILLVILLNIPYTLLTLTFEYDEILRKPSDYVLTKFHEGGSGLILTWFAFALAALLFIPACIFLHQIIKNVDNTPYLATATFIGALSGILQSVGLMRWVFVVPVLASLYTKAEGSTTTREAVTVVYYAVHQYGGVVIGEYLGQTLLICWTLGVATAMLHSPLFKTWVAWWGLFTTPLLLLGQSELLATAIPEIPVVEATPIGFILWEIWVLILGISLVRVPQKRLVPKQENL